MVAEIVWSGGSIPVGQRDDFFFSAKAPAEETTLTWKAYQTYADGNVVSWELTPEQEQPKDEEGNDDFSKFGPASQTKVINDLTQATEENSDKTTQNVMGTKGSSDNALILSIVAIVLAAGALGMQFMKKK
jgi:hypothetical protein